MKEYKVLIKLNGVWQRAYPRRHPYNTLKDADRFMQYLIAQNRNVDLDKYPEYRNAEYKIISREVSEWEDE
jgi:hypothetical protein